VYVKYAEEGHTAATHSDMLTSAYLSAYIPEGTRLPGKTSRDLGRNSGNHSQGLQHRGAWLDPRSPL
jgi:hypothetical protein